MASEPMTLRAPRAEGDGYYAGRALQWVDTCPHLNHPERTLLRVLTNLTLEYTQVRKITPAALQKMIYVGAVGLGETPKTISSSGLLRLLRALATLGQITDPDGNPLTFSSGEKAQLNGVSMSIWRYPRHECGYARNSHDALAIVTEGDSPRYGPTGLDSAATWPESASDQPGSETNQPGSETNQPGSETNQPGSETNHDTQRDLRELDPPLSSSLSSPSSSSGAAETTPSPDASEDEEEGSPSAGTRPGVLPVDLVVEATDATREEALELVEVLRPEAKKSLGGLIRRMAEKGDLDHRLWLLRRQRAPQPRTGASGNGRAARCAVHDPNPIPCGSCRADLGVGGKAAQAVIDLYVSLGADAATLRPDLAPHPKIAALTAV